MSYRGGSGWLLKYADPRNDTRLLMSLPSEMLRDLRLLAKSQDIPVAELVRRAVTREIAAEIRSRPEIAPSFKGKLLT